MGLFQRLKTLFSANVNSLIDKAEDPEKMLNQIIVDMNNQLIESKRSVAMAIADEKKLARETENQAETAKEWERKAMLAVKAGDDNLAKEALLRKQEYDNNYAQYNKQWLAQKQSVDALKNSLRDLQNKISEAQRKKNLLVARAKRAEAQEKIQKTMTSISSNQSAFEAFDRMASKVDQIEAQAEAARDLDAISADADLEKKFAALESGNAGADMLLEDLKAKMKALPEA